MGYFLLAITIIATVFTFRFWVRFFTARLKPLNRPFDLADLSTMEAEIVGMFLPRSARRVWNMFVLTLCAFLLGTPHWLAIWQFWRRPEIDVWHFIHYAWTLAWWLALLACLALPLARRRVEIRSRQVPSTS